MDWSELLTLIIKGVIAIVIPIIGVAIKTWISSHVKDENAKLALSFVALVTDAVTNTYQTYVEALKGTDEWTEEAQKTALTACYDYIIRNMPADVNKWLTKNQTDIKTFITDEIETIVGKTKTK